MIACLLSFLSLGGLAFGQASAINATIEGVIHDESGGAIPGAAVTVTNSGTGLMRVVTSNEAGYYRAQLLPLGTYTVAVEIPGFASFARDGLTLTAGMTARVDIILGLGRMEESVTVAADSPVVDPAKIELGRVLDSREIRNIPLVSRNPFNFALLQANVTGYENEEFGVPRINANGTQMRTNYQMDGNTNMQKNRAGLRLAPISEVMVQEVNVVTSGFAPEFGKTTGMVYNVVTPSGTNDIGGSASYRFRRKAFSARPFFLSGDDPKPDTNVDAFTAAVGGPIRSDKAHYYFGYEKVKRDLSADRVITVDPGDRFDARHSERSRRRRHPGGCGRELLHRQRKFPAQLCEPALRSLFALRSGHRRQYRRRPEHAGAKPRFRRSGRQRRRAAGLDLQR